MRADALGEGEVVAGVRDQRADEVVRAGDEPGAGLAAHGVVEDGLVGAGEDHDREPLLEPERLEPAAQLLALELAGEQAGEDVAGEAALGVGGDAAAQHLQRDDRHGLVDDELVELGHRPVGAGGEQAGARVAGDLELEAAVVG